MARAGKNNVRVVLQVDDQGTVKIQRFGDKADKSFKQVESSALGLSKGFVALGTALAGAFSLATVTGVLRDTMALGDQWDKMSRRVGVSVEELSGFGFALERSGSDIKAGEIALKYLSKAMSDFERGTGEGRVAFEALGIQVRQGNGPLRGSMDILMEVADKLSRMEDETQRVAYAQKLFGESGTQLLPLLMEGSEGIRDLTDRSRELGGVWSDQDAKAAAELTDKMTDLSTAWDGLSRKMMVKASPVLVYWLELATGLLSDADDGAQGAAGSYQRLIDQYQAELAALKKRERSMPRNWRGETVYPPGWDAEVERMRTLQADIHLLQQMQVRAMEKQQAEAARVSDTSGQIKEDWVGIAQASLMGLDTWYFHDKRMKELAESSHECINAYTTQITESNSELEHSYSRLIVLSERTGDAIEQNFSDFLYNSRRGYESWGDAVIGVFESIERAACDLAGQMLKMQLFGEDGAGGLIGSALSALFNTAPAASSIHVGAGGTTAVGMASGGWITEPIVGMGKSGQVYTLGEDEAELVTPRSRLSGGGSAGGGQVINLTYAPRISALDGADVRSVLARDSRAVAEALISELRSGNRPLDAALRRGR